MPIACHFPCQPDFPLQSNCILLPSTHHFVPRTRRPLPRSHHSYLFRSRLSCLPSGPSSLPTPSCSLTPRSGCRLHHGRRLHHCHHRRRPHHRHRRPSRRLHRHRHQRRHRQRRHRHQRRRHCQRCDRACMTATAVQASQRRRRCCHRWRPSFAQRALRWWSPNDDVQATCASGRWRRHRPSRRQTRMSPRRRPPPRWPIWPMHAGYPRLQACRMGALGPRCGLSRSRRRRR